MRVIFSEGKYDYYVMDNVKSIEDMDLLTEIPMSTNKRCINFYTKEEWEKAKNHFTKDVYPCLRFDESGFVSFKDRHYWIFPASNAYRISFE